VLFRSSSSAEKLLFRRSCGVPRRVNQLCDRAFLAAALRDGARVEREDVARAAESLSDGGSGADRPMRWFRRSSWLAALLLPLTRFGKGGGF